MAAERKPKSKSDAKKLIIGLKRMASPKPASFAGFFERVGAWGEFIEK